MNIPGKLKIGGHEIKIEINDTAHLNDAGEFNGYHNIIRLRKEADTPEDNISEALLHEIIECIKIKNNLEINHTVLTVLSESLFQTIRDNKLNFYEIHNQSVQATAKSHRA